MTREILFRGKNKYTGKWEEGDLRHIWAFDEYRPHIVDNSNKMNNSVCGCEVIAETVGRYTGLTDKNGRKIFEGDILSAHLDDNFPKDETIVVVVWAHNAWCIQEGSEPAIIEDNELEDDGWEIIGNIHDNPGLLEVIE